MNPDSSLDQTARQRVPTACEACRASKLRCRPSERPGICQNCVAYKRECVSRSIPRKRRSQRPSRTQSDVENTPLATGPSRATFSIDCPVPAPPENDSGFEALREIHSTILDKMFPDDLVIGSFSRASIKTPSSSGHSQALSVEDLHARPQFNLSSAQSLLDAFQNMLPYLPCIRLPRDCTVRDLASSRPFVLLAILASAAGSRTLQGHSLYDEEFRKVLGLKFVAGGERSLELLQGILIYCAWYPFHLRPRNKQVFHYLRMAGDVIHDLELDQDSGIDETTGETSATDTQTDGIRAYLSYFYMASAFMAYWKSHTRIEVAFSSWTAKCCEILERNAASPDDVSLATLARFGGIMSEAAGVLHKPAHASEQQTRLMLLGLETEFLEIQRRLAVQAHTPLSARLSSPFVSLILKGGMLLLRPQSALQTPPIKLHACVDALKEHQDIIGSLEESDFMNFTGVDWVRLIVGIILASRLSFPLPANPDWNVECARARLQLGHVIDALCRGPDLSGLSKKVDVLSATRVVLQMVKEKYEHRVALDHAAAVAPKGLDGCPMLDGRMNQYISAWDTGSGEIVLPLGEGAPQPIFHDLWETLTLGWASGDMESQSMDAFI